MSREKIGFVTISYANFHQRIKHFIQHKEDPKKFTVVN